MTAAQRGWQLVCRRQCPRRYCRPPPAGARLHRQGVAERALVAEGARQQAILDGGGAVTQVSLTFNADTGQVRAMREKEASRDYRYFPDPDLPPLLLDDGWVAECRAQLPELPAARRARLISEFGLSPYDAGVVNGERLVGDYFEAVVGAGADPKAAANWVSSEAMIGFNATGMFAVAAARLAQLIGMVRDGVVSHQAARHVYAELGAAAGEPRQVAERLGLLQVRDTVALEQWVTEVLGAHPAEVERFRGGDTKLLGFFTGQVMRRSQGQADPQGIQPILVAKLRGE